MDGSRKALASLRSADLATTRSPYRSLNHAKDAGESVATKRLAFGYASRYLPMCRA